MSPHNRTFFQKKDKSVKNKKIRVVDRRKKIAFLNSEMGKTIHGSGHMHLRRLKVLIKNCSGLELITCFKIRKRMFIELKDDSESNN